MPPLGLVWAFAGSRHGSPWAVGPVVRAVLSSGGFVRVGCARGVDAAVRSVAPHACVLYAAHFSGPVAARLASRTRSVVSGAQVLAVFPPKNVALGPGSALAVSVAVACGLPVWVAGLALPPGLPSGFVSCVVAGVPGFSRVPIAAQSRLF